MYNLDNLKKALGNNEETLKNLLKVFFRTVPEQLNNINEAYQVKNIEEIIFIAHKLKTSFLTVGMIELVELIKEIQNDCKNNDFSKVSHLLDTLSEKTEKELISLQKEL